MSQAARGRGGVAALTVLVGFGVYLAACLAVVMVAGRAFHPAPPRHGVPGEGLIRSQVQGQGAQHRCATSSSPGLFSLTRQFAQGELHVSTIRMVFINHSGGDMQAFDLPMANITNEKFNQPIFGANNISGTVAAVRGAHTVSGAFVVSPTV